MSEAKDKEETPSILNDEPKYADVCRIDGGIVRNQNEIGRLQSLNRTASAKLLEDAKALFAPGEVLRSSMRPYGVLSVLLDEKTGRVMLEVFYISDRGLQYRSQWFLAVMEYCHRDPSLRLDLDALRFVPVEKDEEPAPPVPFYAYMTGEEVYLASVRLFEGERLALWYKVRDNRIVGFWSGEEATKMYYAMKFEDDVFGKEYLPSAVVEAMDARFPGGWSL